MKEQGFQETTGPPQGRPFLHQCHRARVVARPPGRQGWISCTPSGEDHFNRGPWRCRIVQSVLVGRPCGEHRPTRRPVSKVGYRPVA